YLLGFRATCCRDRVDVAAFIVLADFADKTESEQAGIPLIVLRADGGVVRAEPRVRPGEVARGLLRDLLSRVAVLPNLVEAEENTNLWLAELWEFPGGAVLWALWFSR